MMAAKEEFGEAVGVEDFKPEAHSQIPSDGIKVELVPNIKKESKDEPWHFTDEEGDFQGREDEIEIKEEFPAVLDNIVENIKSEEDTEFTLPDRSQTLFDFRKSAIRSHNRKSRIKGQRTEKEVNRFNQNEEAFEVAFQESGKYRCAICAKLFRRKYYMKLHIRLHEGVGYNCGTCGKTFTHKNKLRRHIAVHQSDRYDCKVCGKSYCRDDLLKMHFETVHEGKGHRCSICSKLFSASFLLKNHLETHVDKTKCDVGRHFDCSLCGKSFSQKVSLRFHLEAHDGIKPTCPVCGKSYKTNSDLQKHLLKHENLRYKCSMCGKTYAEKKHLIMHIRKQLRKRRNCAASLSRKSVSQKHFKIQKAHHKQSVQDAMDKPKTGREGEETRSFTRSSDQGAREVQDNFYSALNGKKRPPVLEKRGRPEENDATETGLPKSKGKLSTKPIPFRNLPMTQKKVIMLSWILKESSVQQIYLKHRKGNEADLELCTDNIPDSIKDSDVHIELLEEYFEPGAWSVLLEVVKRKKDCELWICGFCRSELKAEPCICCDSCLLWYHLTCMKLRTVPKTKLWMCTKCHR